MGSTHARTSLKYTLFILISFLLFMFIRSVKHYPFWWWFLPYERFLCDSVLDPANSSLNHSSSIFSYFTSNSDKRSSLKCYYAKRSTLFRYKVEEMNRNPDLIVIRDFLFNLDETGWVYDYVREYSRPSPVYTLLTNLEVEKDFMKLLDFRTSRTMSLAPEEAKDLYVEAERVSGLTVSNLDGWFDILWYKKFGHIIPHHDVYPHSDSIEFGRRFATMIIYFKEPNSGGATIFPKLGAAIKPSAGDSVLWYNTKVTNEPDPLLAHAGCPVWEGEKVIGTFWFRHFYQEFRKKCPPVGQYFSFS